MNPVSWRRVEELFASALEQPPESRAEYVLGFDDPDTRREVLSLLQAHDGRGRLDSLTAALSGLTAAAPFTSASDLAPRLSAALAGRYRIESEIGRGGTALVFSAEDLKHHRKVALKVLQPGLTRVLGAARFLREITIAAQLVHPHILPLHDSGEADGLLYYVMPYVAGESLRDLLQRERRLPLMEALNIAREVADAVSYAHSHGVVHRDLKPENILIQAGHAVVSDFGIARAMTAAGADELSETGVIIGTPAYISPEQIASGQHVDGRSDVYSLGCVLYEMLAGQLPFAGSEVETVLTRKATEAAPSVRAGHPAVPEAVDRALRRALATKAEDRYASMSLFAADLHLPASAPIRRRRLLVAAAALALAFTGANGYLRSRDNTARSAPIRSLAVLPLQNRTADPAQEYFVAGMQEALITELGRISALTVISRASSMRYRNGGRPMHEIARDLNVQALVAGSMQQVGEKIRIQVRVIGVVPREHDVWTGTFEAQLGDVPSLQKTIAAAIADRINVTLTPQEQTQLVRVHAVNPRAYDAWVRGWFQLTRWTGTSLRSCIDHAGEAIRLDSSYAPAYALTALCYNILPHIAPVHPRDAFPKARAAARRALELDESLADAHFALAWALAAYDRDWAGAEREYRRGLALNPNSAYGHGRFEFLLSALGRYDEAVAESQRAITLSPVGPNEINAHATALYAARRYDEAIAAALRAIEIDPGFSFGYDRLGWAYTEIGRYAEAIGSLKKAVELSGDSPSFKAELARAYALSGDRGAAYRILDELRRLDRDGYASPAWIGLVHLALGDRDEALSWLERGYQERDPNMMLLRGLPMWDGLRNEPRFEDLLRRMRFPS